MSALITEQVQKSWTADRLRLVHVGAAVVTVIATLMPWVSMFFVTVSGIHLHYGTPVWFALIALGIVLCEHLLEDRRWAYLFGATVLPVVVAVYAGSVIGGAYEAKSEDESEIFGAFLQAALQPGVYLALIGGVTVLVLTVVRARKKTDA